MDIPMDAEVFCTDGYCGRSMAVILKPETEEVTHLVVREKKTPHEELLIPVTAVTVTTPDSINLSYTREKLGKLQRFIDTEYVRVTVPRYVGGDSSLVPYAYAEPEVLAVRRKVVPNGELALCRGARVEATDGHVGSVDELLVDPENEHITHLVLREGHLWGQKEVRIPASAVERIEEDTVHLRVSKRQIEALPAAPLRRKGH